MQCDAPVDLAKSMIAAVERIAPNRTGSIFTGDIVEGAVWMTNKSEVVGDITAWNGTVHEYPRRRLRRLAHNPPCRYGVPDLPRRRKPV